MNKKRITLLFVILLSLIVVTVISAALCIFLARRSSVDDKEQESETFVEEESSVEKETVAVEGGDAVSELYAALKAAVSGTGADMAEIIERFSKSADMGNSDAMYFLGELYFQGIGVGRDMEKAGEYFKKACESGNRKAMSIYGKMLFMGDGVPQNYEESASCFYTVADEDGEASYMLGVMSNLGMGVPRSAKRAAKYIDNAEALGYEKAHDYRDKIYDDKKSLDGTDGFKLVAKKVQDLDYRTEYDDLEELAEKYRSILKTTGIYDAFNSELAGLPGLDINGVSTNMLFGNNGYLFHKNEIDGTSLHDYIGDNHFSKEELKVAAEKLEKEKKWIEQNGAKFVLLLIPNKETVYSEYMPSYIKRSDTLTRQDLFVEYLEKNTDIDVVYTKDTLVANKDRYPLYYKTDTHANMVGSLFMVADLFNTCYDVEITPDLSKFETHLRDYMGDLGKSAGCTKRYASDTVYYYPEKAVEDGDKIESSMMLVGDSFSEFVNIEAGYYLSGGVDHRMLLNYGYDYHAATQAGFASSKPEYVVWECVERYLYIFNK